MEISKYDNIYHDIFFNILKEMDSIIALEERDDLLTKKLVTNGFSEDDAGKIVDSIDAILKRLDDLHTSLSKGRESGISRVAWFSERMKKVQQKNVSVQIRSLMTSIEAALYPFVEEQRSLREKVENETVHAQRNVVKGELDTNLILREINNHLKNNVYGMLDSLQDVINDGDALDESRTTDEYLRSSFNSNIDKIYRKIAAVSLIITQQRIDDSIIDQSVVNRLTSAADLGTNTTKVVYKFSNGEMNGADTVEWLIDRAAVVVINTIDDCIEKSNQVVLSSVAGLIAGIFNPLAGVVVLTVGPPILRTVSRKIRPLLIEGIRCLSNIFKIAWRGIRQLVSIQHRQSINK